MRDSTEARRCLGCGAEYYTGGSDELCDGCFEDDDEVQPGITPASQRQSPVTDVEGERDEY